MTDPNRQAGMQRVRVGLTGLAVVLLLIVLATVVFRTVDKQVVATNPKSDTNNSDVSKDEPLADLGVAPGSAPSGNKVEEAPPAKN